jgi:hypothetical protein
MAESQPSPSPALEGGSYEVIRQRLDRHGAELTRRLDLLNADRKAEFGGIETALLAAARLTTENNCVPRDMTAIGPQRFLFGCNVQLGLRTTMRVEDVFAVFDYDPSAHALHPCREPLLADAAFAADFAHHYKYYKNAAFLKFHRIGPHLYMVMQAGRDTTEVKTFKWLVNDDAGTISYLGSRFEHEFVYPPAHEFEWKRARREHYVEGEHPHISIEDRVFVECLGGDLTVKVENNTLTGRGIYHEPVENKDQTLDDAEIHYAIAGNLILLKVLPYQEKTWRYLVFNERTREAHRLDSIAESCVHLPDGHGLLFPHGCVLQTGMVRRFDTGLPAMRFERRITAANGEDTLFVFSHLESGSYLLLSYNLITQSIATPVMCHGYSLFPGGELLFFSGDHEPRKHHPVQVWSTPFLRDDKPQTGTTQSFLGKIGNAEIVRCMAECRAVLTLLSKDDSFSGLYVELVRATGDITDTYFWIDRSESHKLKEVLLEIQGTAETALAEFEKVRRMRAAAAEQTAQLQTEVEKGIRAAATADSAEIPAYVQLLASLRTLRGRIIGLRDVRYVEIAETERMDASVAEAADRLSQKCIAFFLKPEALDPYRRQIEEQSARVPSLEKVTDAAAVDTELEKSGGELELLTAIVSDLKITDATETTRIIEGISTLFARLNQVRSVLRNRRSELARSEGAAQFQAQLSLLSQAVLNAMETCTTPEKCDEALARAMLQIGELETRFSDFEDYASELITKREEVQGAFDARRQSLVDARNRRSQALGQSAERILSSARSRVAAFRTPEEVHAWMAGDAMIARLRDLLTDLRELGDSVRADELQTRLKSLHQDSLKEIRDKADLFTDGGDLVQLGGHKFSVNRQPLELTLLARDGSLAFHLTGTRYFEPLASTELESLRHVWDQEAVSENADVYRGEYLAWQFVQSADAGAFLALSAEERGNKLRDFMHERFHDGYTRGVHDHDAALIAAPLLEMQRSLGLLRHAPAARALALICWHAWPDGAEKQALAAKLQARGRMRTLLGGAAPAGDDTLPSAVADFIERGKFHRFLKVPAAGEIAACLADELEQLTSKHPALPFTRSNAAVETVRNFRRELTAKRAASDFDASLKALAAAPVAAFETALDWLRALHSGESEGILAEAAALLLLGDSPPAKLPPAPLSHTRVSGLTGSHARIQSGALAVDYHEFTARLRRYCAEVVPAYESYHRQKHELIQERRKALRLEQFKAAVLSSFVRNRLLDDVYLPLIGANLAKQIGAAGTDTRTDRMGLLLLISPPGYGKTTLMEYVASRLGITLVKINGPALGHQVTSLDPAEAPNASAREEVNRLNLALEMGDNVMIYIDDIQHTNSEFLQKFIPLCDGTRRMEGVFRGQAKTYDLRGRKVAVVMAGNPYTETGGRFQVPDMLANRADTYNLGEILGGHAAAFEDSYIENCLTSNSILARLAARSHADALAVLKIAKTGNREGIEFEASHSAEEIGDCAALMERLLKVRSVILRVNQEYIRSAATEDAYRTEPPFKLQGSYRNMNKIAEKVLPVMTPEEVDRLIADHYRSEAQTLSKAAESNLLKWREINNLLTEAETARWAEIRRTFGRNLLTGGNADNDPVTRITGQLNAFNAGLEKIEQAVRQPSLSEQTMAHLQKIIEGLRAVPVAVEINVQPVEQPAPGQLPVAVESTVEQKVE